MKTVKETIKNKKLKVSVIKNISEAIDSVSKNSPLPRNKETSDFILRMKKALKKLNNPLSYLDSEQKLRFKDNKE